MNTCLSAKLTALLIPLSMNALLLVTVAYLYGGRSHGWAVSNALRAVW